MNIISKSVIKPLLFPLPIYTAIQIAEVTSKDGENFYLFVGLDLEMIAEIKTLSLDKSDIELHKYANDFKRFGVGSYEEWYKKNRTPFTLIHKETKKIAALIWLGPMVLEKQQGNWHGVAWRSYKPFRGKGLMRGFCNFVIDIYGKNISDMKLWGKFKKENTPSVGLATGLGFQILEEASNEEYLIMVK